MRRRFGAYILSQHDNLPLGDIASILADSESFVRYSIDDVERRIYKYRALSLLSSRWPRVMRSQACEQGNIRARQ